MYGFLYDLCLKRFHDLMCVFCKSHCLTTDATNITWSSFGSILLVMLGLTLIWFAHCQMGNPIEYMSLLPLAGRV